MTTLFVACAAVGAIGLVAALLFGDIGEADAEFGGIPFVTPTVVATAVFGFGGSGLLCLLVGLPSAVALGIAAVVAVLEVVASRFLLYPYLLRQQDNSHVARTSYIGSLGTVTLAIEPGGWGEVSFVDRGGSRVRARAVTHEPETLGVSTTVYIADVDETSLHVVAVPGDALTGHA
ncbi:hypothetical protein DW322_00760 [Rhodococcus rhodnii]|uniref:Membrane protein NfeD2 N-terminal transmembrane domain-containing protein n=2 Tax=Rhodococcus rhodnii TaxID=38312 RepID=R7WR15_9NOCA|nr:NfeD family protein [Rhodococcus rhodnii]EOM77756.1 hypothetical protein Rrhod_0909 [Rhodococcus rhodnii LMG 5362]TXG89036.1 hypothetical protein DW322_00760 [Rhodococcus rhodnii]